MLMASGASSSSKGIDDQPKRMPRVVDEEKKKRKKLWLSSRSQCFGLDNVRWWWLVAVDVGLLCCP